MADVAHQRARIDFGADGHARLFEITVGFGSLRQLLARARTRGQPDLRYRAGGFAVARVGAVVADLGIGQNDDLARVRGIGEDLLVAGDGSIEDNLAGSSVGAPKAPALEDRAVFQGQDCCIQAVSSGEGVRTISARPGECSTGACVSEPAARRSSAPSFDHAHQARRRRKLPNFANCVERTVSGTCLAALIKPPRFGNGLLQGRHTTSGNLSIGAAPVEKSNRRVINQVVDISDVTVVRDLIHQLAAETQNPRLDIPLWDQMSDGFDVRSRIQGCLVESFSKLPKTIIHGSGIGVDCNYQRAPSTGRARTVVLDFRGVALPYPLFPASSAAGQIPEPNIVPSITKFVQVSADESLVPLVFC